MRSESALPIVIKRDEIDIDDPFDLDNAVQAYVHDIAEFTLLRLKRHLADHGIPEDAPMDDDADAA